MKGLRCLGLLVRQVGGIHAENMVPGVGRPRWPVVPFIQLRSFARQKKGRSGASRRPVNETSMVPSTAQVGNVDESMDIDEDDDFDDEDMDEEVDTEAKELQLDDYLRKPESTSGKRSVGVSWNRKNGNIVDYIDNKGKTGSSKSKASLQSKEQGVISSAAVGEINATGEEVCRHLNMFLMEMKRFSIFKGVRPGECDRYITFEKAEVNSEYTRVVAFWSSSILAEFWATLELDNTVPRKKSVLYRRKTIKYIQDQLQSHEGKFRTYLMRKMDFKRVPHVRFSHHDRYKAVEENEVFNELLRENMINPKSGEDLYGANKSGHI
jgi:hypothetical protein